MKTDFVMSVFALCTAYLVSFGLYNNAAGSPYGLPAAMVSSLCFTVTLVPCLAVRFEQQKLTRRLRILAAVFFAAFLTDNLFFTLVRMVMIPYLLINSALLLTCLLAMYLLLKFSLDKA